jgi:hypothetical protein
MRRKGVFLRRSLKKTQVPVDHRRDPVDHNQISDKLYAQLKELYEISSNKETLPHPDDLRSHPFFIMIESLQIITDATTKTDQESNDLFAKYYSVCLRGVNPFRESVLKKAGIDSKTWKRLLKAVSGDY